MSKSTISFTNYAGKSLIKANWRFFMAPMGSSWRDLKHFSERLVKGHGKCRPTRRQNAIGNKSSHQGSLELSHYNLSGRRSLASQVLTSSSYSGRRREEEKDTRRPIRPFKRTGEIEFYTHKKSSKREPWHVKTSAGGGGDCQVTVLADFT